MADKVRCSDNLRIVVVDNVNHIAKTKCDRFAGHDGPHQDGGLGFDYCVTWKTGATLHVGIDKSTREKV
jgi:hypothetical protein